VNRSDGFRQQFRDRQRFDPVALLRLFRERNRIRKTTSFKHEASIRLTAGPESTAWVAQAETLAAPFCISASAPFTSVPAVSIKSSTSRQ